MPKKIFLTLINCLFLFTLVPLAHAEDPLENISESVFQKLLNEEYKEAFTSERILNIQCVEQNKMVITINSLFTGMLFVLAVSVVILAINLHKNKTLTRKYLDKVSMMVLMLDRRARVKMINTYGATLLGYEKDELMGKNFIGIAIPMEQRDIFTDKFSRITRGLEKIPQENEQIEFVTKSGEKKKLRWSNFVIMENIKIKYMVGTGLDITEEYTIGNIYKVK